VTEATDLTFDRAKKNAIDVWEESLRRITVEGGKEADLTKFYTGSFSCPAGQGAGQ